MTIKWAEALLIPSFSLFPLQHENAECKSNFFAERQQFRVKNC